jgi:hypothetical protein
MYAIQIREFREGDLDAVVAFSLRAWEPVFDSLREVLGDEIFLRLHPDWRSNQADVVKSSCLSEQRDVFVAVADGEPVPHAARLRHRSAAVRTRLDRPEEPATFVQATTVTRLPGRTKPSEPRGSA